VTVAIQIDQERRRSAQRLRGENRRPQGSVAGTRQRPDVVHCLEHQVEGPIAIDVCRAEARAGTGREQPHWRIECPITAPGHQVNAVVLTRRVRHHDQVWFAVAIEIPGDQPFVNRQPRLEIDARERGRLGCGDRRSEKDDSEQ
jgi:hypothetical protein